MSSVARPNADAHKFNFEAKESGLSKEEGRRAQLILAGWTLRFVRGRLAQRIALKTILSAAGLLQRIELDEEPEEKQEPIRLNYLKDNYPRVRPRQGQ